MSTPPPDTMPPADGAHADGEHGSHGLGGVSADSNSAVAEVTAASPAAAAGVQDSRPAPAATSTRADAYRLHADFHSEFLAKDRSVVVYLPPGYDAERERRYPVLYLQDGQNLFDGATSFIYGQHWRVGETADSLIRAGVVEPLVIVGIYNAGERRIEEYTPTKDGRTRLGGQADLYGRFLVEELKPFVDERYRTLTDAPNTGLGGSSLGGLVSLHLGIKYPHVFGKLAVLSPSIWWDRRVILSKVRTLDIKPPVRVWIDVGTAEGDYAVKDAALLRDALVARGWVVGVDLKYLEAEGARHDELAWAERVAPVLKFLFPNEA